MSVRPPLVRRAFAIAVLLLLGGCANGDFKEVRPALVRDDIHDWIGPNAYSGRPASDFPLTDDERELRDLAYPLIEPPYKRQRWYSVFNEYGLGRHDKPFDPTAYAAHLMKDDVRSPATRYARLEDDISDDITRLPAFFETAGRVFDMDRKRRESLAYFPVVSETERANTLLRNDENAHVVALVQRSLAQRVAAYRFALERLVLVTPSPQAAQSNHLLEALQARIDFYRHVVPPTWHRPSSLDWQPS